MHLVDTNVAIYLRDVDPVIGRMIDALPDTPALSILSWIELEGGIHVDPANAAKRRITLDALIDLLPILPIDADVVATYGRIVAARGFSRRRIIDRLIAATAIVHDLTLITINAADFRDVPGLRLEIWPAQ